MEFIALLSTDIEVNIRGFLSFDVLYENASHHTGNSGAARPSCYRSQRREGWYRLLHTWKKRCNGVIPLIEIQGVLAALEITRLYFTQICYFS